MSAADQKILRCYTHFTSIISFLILNIIFSQCPVNILDEIGVKVDNFVHADHLILMIYTDFKFPIHDREFQFWSQSLFKADA